MKKHRTDGLSLTFGLIFLVITVWWLAAQTVNLSLPNAGWFVAGTLIVLGVLGLVGALRAGRGGPPQDEEIAPPEAAVSPGEPAAASVDTTADLPKMVDEPRGVERE